MLHVWCCSLAIQNTYVLRHLVTCIHSRKRNIFHPVTLQFNPWHWPSNVDDDEKVETERRQDSVNMARNPLSACQAHCLSTPSDYISRVQVNSDGSGCGFEPSAVHGFTSHCSLLGVLLSVAATACRTAVIDNPSFRPSSTAVWTTVMLYSLRLPRVRWNGYKLFRMLQLVWCLWFDAEIMSRRFCATFICCQ